MGKRDKKKGQGLEKTAAKTEKNLSKKLKRHVNKTGEESVERTVARLAELQRRAQTAEPVCEPPSGRSGCTLSAHPERDELLLYGGEYFNGKNTTVYGDLYQYQYAARGGQWRRLQYPGGPPPRSGHAAAVAPLGGGQLWLLAGEYTSTSGEQFHHYRDLWCLHTNTKQWEQISAKDAPSARSGHRMVYFQKQLIVFGGFHDNMQSFQYFNDLHAFDIDKREWRALNVTGSGPSPRSGVVFLPLSDGRILLYGGYCKQKLKKNVEQGTTFSDMYLLTPDKHDATLTRWRWSAVKQSGAKPSARGGVSACCLRGNHLLFFGGVVDEETDDTLSGTFFNDTYTLDASKGIWNTVTLSGRRDPARRRRRQQRPDNSDAADQLEALSIEEPPAAPSPRARAALAVRGSQLFLYGGQVERGSRDLTLGDLYQLDVSKMDEWKTLVEQPAELDWEGSDDDSMDDEDDTDDGDDDDEEDSEDEDDDSDMEDEDL